MIECKICNRVFLSGWVTPAHLSTHGVTTKDYREKFGNVLSQELLQRRTTRLGAKHTAETKKILSAKTKIQLKTLGYPMKGKRHNPASIQKMSETKKQMHQECPEIFKNSIRTLQDYTKINGAHNKGEILNFEGRKKMSARRQGIPIEEWTGFQKSERSRAMSKPEYKFWRAYVLWRDDYKCEFCCSKQDLEVDHVKPWKSFPELRHDIDNGRVLCHNCHTKTPSYPKHLRRSV